MAISLASLRRAGEVEQPPRIVIFGVHGVGKTSLAAGAPSPVFIQTEDGIADPRLADIPTFGVLSQYSEVYEAITSLYTEDHSFKTVIIDTLDWLEPIIWREAADRNGWEDIETPGYGKGYMAALDVWREFFGGLTALRNDRGMGIIMLAHAAIKKFEAPDTEPYDRYRIKLHESAAGIGAAPLVQEHVDCVLFVNYVVSITKDKKTPMGKAADGHARGVGSGQRAVYTAERPAFLAKNRYGMQDMILLPNDPSKAWPTVAAQIPYYNPAAA
jgi:hypothetical protein